MQQECTTWKTNNWVLIKKGINLNGAICDLYENIKTGQQVYEAVVESKLQFTRAADIHSGNVSCPDQGDNCWLGTVDGVDVLIIKQKK